MNDVQKISEHKTSNHPTHAIQCYIEEMLAELSIMATSSGLLDLASLLRATHKAASINVKIED